MDASYSGGASAAAAALGYGDTDDALEAEDVVEVERLLAERDEEGEAIEKEEVEVEVEEARLRAGEEAANEGSER